MHFRVSNYVFISLGGVMAATYDGLIVSNDGTNRDLSD
jgi:hypothetical protein